MDEPLPFDDDEPLALYDASNQETDIFVTLAYLEQEITAAFDEAEQMVYKSDDAPVVEPMPDDEE